MPRTLFWVGKQWLCSLWKTITCSKTADILLQKLLFILLKKKTKQIFLKRWAYFIWNYYNDFSHSVLSGVYLNRKYCFLQTGWVNHFPLQTHWETRSGRRWGSGSARCGWKATGLEPGAEPAVANHSTVHDLGRKQKDVSETHSI